MLSSFVNICPLYYQFLCKIYVGMYKLGEILSIVCDNSNQDHKVWSFDNQFGLSVSDTNLLGGVFLPSSGQDPAKLD